MDGISLLLFVAVAAVLMLVMSIPQRRAQRAHREMIAQLGPGDEVVTLGGIYGTITEVEEGDTVLLEISEDTDIRVARAAIGRVVSRAGAPEGDAAEPETGPAPAADTE